MKRLASSESLGALFSNSQEEKASLGLHSILDGLEEDDCLEEAGHMSEKKRRLSVEQVKALEKNFEVENKLEPDRKVKLAQELSLQPRQVAVWFQNRRARWKTKQLEKDYTLLKANYESLKLNFNALQHDKEALLAELGDIKSKHQDKNTESKAYIKEELIQETHETDTQVSESEYKPSFQVKIQTFNNEESDSSAALDNSSPQDAISPDGPLPKMMMMISPIISSSLSLDSGGSSVSNSSVNCHEFKEADHISANAPKGYHQFMRTEEHNFLNSPEESCNFFSDEQAPSLMWYCGEPWN